MREYVPTQPPADVRQLPAWLQAELRALQTALPAADVLRLAPTTRAPVKPRAGEIRLADGTHWNPGAGQGFYGYYNGTWQKLG